MKTLIAAITLISGYAWAQVPMQAPESVTLPVPIAQPAIVALELGDYGCVIYDTLRREWRVSLMAVLSDGSRQRYAAKSIPMDDVYAILEQLDPATDWQAKAPLLIQAIKMLAAKP